MARQPARELAAFFARLAEQDTLRADELAFLCQYFGQPRQGLSEPLLVGLEATLSVSADERLRRIGLALLSGRARSASGWSGPLVERLRIYRADPSSLVAAAAQFIFTDDE